MQHIVVVGRVVSSRLCTADVAAHLCTPKHTRSSNPTDQTMAQKTHRWCLNKDFISKETKLCAECAATSKFSKWKTMYVLLMKNKSKQG